MSLIRFNIPFLLQNTSHARSNTPIESPKKGILKPYSFHEEIKVILTYSINYIWAIKAVFHLGMSYLFEKAGNALDSPTLRERAVSQKFNVSHELCKIARAWAKSKFGDRLLVPARNIGQFYNNGATKESIEELLNRYKKLPEIQKLIRTNPEFEKQLSSNFMHGICWAATVEFLKRLLNEEKSLNRVLTEVEMENVAKNFSEGAPVDAEALFSIYDQVFDFAVKDDKNPFQFTGFDEIRFAFSNLKHHHAPSDQTDFVACIDELRMLRKKLNEEYQTTISLDALIAEINTRGMEKWIYDRFDKRQYSQLSPEQKWVVSILEYYAKDKVLEQLKHDNWRAQIYKEMVLHTRERYLNTLFLNELGLLETSARETTEKVAYFAFFTSTEEQLNKLQHLPNGKYQVEFKTGQGAHSIGYVKINNSGFLFDPNYGLIKCGANHKEDFLTLLSLYPPPEDHNDNYKVYMHGIKLNEKLTPELPQQETMLSSTYYRHSHLKFE